MATEDEERWGAGQTIQWPKTLFSTANCVFFFFSVFSTRHILIFHSFCNLVPSHNFSLNGLVVYFCARHIRYTFSFLTADSSAPLNGFLPPHTNENPDILVKQYLWNYGLCCFFRGCPFREVTTYTSVFDRRTALPPTPESTWNLHVIPPPERCWNIVPEACPQGPLSKCLH